MMKITGVYHDVDPTWTTDKSRGLITLVYVTEGRVSYWIDDKQLILEKGEFIYIPSNLYRAWTNLLMNLIRNIRSSSHGRKGQ